MDTRTPDQRRRIMQAVQSSDTGLELKIRRILHRLGYRYRLHPKDLPGTPDLVFPSRRKAVFVHGCFWHWHGCKYGQLPKSRLDYWQPKLERNRERDHEKIRQLEAAGWVVHVVWQCEIRRDPEETCERLIAFLDDRAVDNPDRHLEDTALQ